MASTDPLTGLANRRFFMDDLGHAIERAKQGGHQVALIALDLHGFQAINSSLGPRYGDRVLAMVAERLKTLADEHLLICRSSSDDFFLRYYPLEGLEPLFRVLERLRELFSTPLQLDDEQQVISAAIGVAVFPDHGDSPGALLTSAETAMHGAESLSGTRYQFFSEGLHQQAQAHLALQKELVEGVERREFEVLYQPQMDLATGQVGALEAKVRWRHPRRGLLARMGQFPLHQIKIDRNFVQRVTASHNDSVIVRAIINLAHNLGIQVTATGVNAEAHLTFLRAHRCDFAQGELISPPLWPQQIPALLSADVRG